MRRKAKTRKATEFSKKWLIGCIMLSISCTAMSYALAWCDKNTVEGLSIHILEILWGASSISFAGYVLQNSVRAFTSSRFGMPTLKGGEKDENRLEEQVDKS